MAQTFADYFVNDLGFDRAELPKLGFYDTNSNGQGYGFLGFEDPNKSNNLWGNNGIIPTILGGAQTVIGGLNAWNGMKQIELANKQYNFARNAFNAQLGNSIENYRNAAANARRVAYAALGGYARNAFGGMSQKEAGNAYGDEVTRNMTKRV